MYVPRREGRGEGELIVFDSWRLLIVPEEPSPKQPSQEREYAA